MPIPALLVWGIIAVIAVVAGGGITFACLSGKKVAFIGMAKAGKSTAVEGFQAIKEENKKWIATPHQPTTNDNNKMYEVLNFKVCIDTSGAQEHKRHWEKTIEKVDWVFYFFDISKLDEIMTNGEEQNRYYKLVQADMRILANLCTEEKKKKLLVIATHTDLDFNPEIVYSRRAEILKELSEYKYVEGSLKNYDTVFELCKKIEEKLK